MSLLRNFATVGGATLTSRVLGLARDVVMAMMLGSGPAADAFFVAFRLPNLFRRLFAEGAFSAAFVPLFARRLEEEGQPAAERFAEDVLAALGLALLAVTAVAELAAPLLVLVLAPGFSGDADKFVLTTVLTRIMFPYLACMSLTAMAAGMLQSLGRFALAAFAPSLLNVVLIAGLGLIWWQGLVGGEAAATILSWSVFVAGILQLLAVAVGLRIIGVRLRFVRPRLTPGVRRMLALGVPGLIAGGVTQLNIVIGTAIASVQDSAVSWLAYADRLYQLPLGVVGVAVGVVLLPDLTRQLRAARADGLHDGASEGIHASLNRSLEFAMALTLPAAAALAAIPVTIIAVLFQRGAFTATDAAATGHALAGFAVGLPAFVLIKVFSPGFFAREDTRTPMIYGFVSMAVNVAGSLVLFPLIGHVGIAVATSLSGWVNAALLGLGLHRRGFFVLDAPARRRLPMLLAASLAMGLLLAAGAHAGASWLDAPSLLVSTLALLVLCGAGGLAYAALVQASGAFDLRRLLRLRRRRAP